MQSGLRLDREGRFFHDGAPVEHEGIARAFTRGLSRTGDGRYVVRLGGDFAYVSVDDAPWQVRRVIPADGALRLQLSDESEETLDPGTLACSPEGVLYARVKGPGERARLSRQAQADLAPFLREEDGRYLLVLGSTRFVIGEDPGSPPPLPEQGPPPPDDLPPGDLPA